MKTSAMECTVWAWPEVVLVLGLATLFVWRLKD